MTAVRSGHLEPRAVALGAAVVVGVALPLAVADTITRDGGGTGLSLVVFLATLAAFVAGGFVAARRTPASPYTTSAVAALAGYVVVAVAAAVSRTARGDDLGLATVVFGGLLAYACGLAGGGLASRRAGKGAQP